MRFSTPILINLIASLNTASAQACEGGTACGYYGTLCCTGNEVCMTDADNQAVCGVPALSSETLVVSSDLTTMMPTMVVSTDAATMTPMPTSRSTQVTTAASSWAIFRTRFDIDSVTSLLSSSTAQSADTSVTSSSASTTGAESTVSTGSADASNAPASTTTTSEGGRVGRSWYGVVGVGVVVATVLMV